MMVKHDEPLGGTERSVEEIWSEAEEVRLMKMSVIWKLNSISIL
jgi:hypothetical protein